MSIIIHKANERGYFNHNWLETYHSFSFGAWYDRNKMNFGTLRVLNDDKIAHNSGFDLHPHANMEIITILLKGKLKHLDSMGNEGIIKENEIQVMSAGSGIMHAEFNPSAENTCELLQIWILPNERNIKPSYDQSSYINELKNNEIVTLIGPKNSGLKLTINQDAFLSNLKIDDGLERIYNFNNKNNGVYIFVIDGSLEIENQLVNKRDAIGLSEIEQVNIKAIEKSEVLFIEVPMVRKYE